MTLSRLMQDNPNATEFNVFQLFVNLAMSIQDQLEEYYKGDLYLRDRFNEAIEIPRIKAFLKERSARSSQQLINRVATQLSDKSRTAASASSPLDTHTDGTDE